MKAILYRGRETGKIIRDFDYDGFINACGREEVIVEKMNEFNEKQKDIFVEMVELDDIAEYYAKRAEQPFSELDDIMDKLSDIADSIADIVLDMKDMVRNRK